MKNNILKIAIVLAVIIIRGCKLNCVSKVNILFYSLLTQFNLHPLNLENQSVLIRKTLFYF